MYGMFWPKTDILSFLAKFFKNEKLIKTKQNKNKLINKQNKTKKSFSMFLDHVDSFGKFLKFFVQKHFFTLVKKKGARTLFLQLSQNYSSL